MASCVGSFPRGDGSFVVDRLTCRLQHDFTDISTSPVARRWAEIDPHVLYVENPHPRAVRDANRARPADLGADLREAFERLRRTVETERPSHSMLPGEDWVMPPADQVNWLAERLRAAHDRVRRWGPALA